MDEGVLHTCHIIAAVASTNMASAKRIPQNPVNCSVSMSHSLLSVDCKGGVSPTVVKSGEGEEVEW